VQDQDTRKRFTQTGGGRDMERQCLAEWLQVTHQEKLRKIKSRCALIYGGGENGEHKYNKAKNALRGMGRFPKSEAIILDPDADSDIDKIAMAIGLKITPQYRQGRYARRIGWDVEVEGS
jgi:hypothetical protein